MAEIKIIRNTFIGGHPINKDRILTIGQPIGKKNRVVLTERTAKSLVLCKAAEYCKMEAKETPDEVSVDDKLIEILTGNVTQVHNALLNLSDDELLRIEELEIEGKNMRGEARTGVINAIAEVQGERK